MPVSRLGRQIAEVAAALNANGVGFALIGGLALASHKVVRATQGVELLSDAESADDIDALLTQLGHRCVHRSADAANPARGDERVDFHYASRPVARRLLTTARELEDMRALLRANRGTLDTAEMRGHFRLFDREALLDELLRESG